MTYYHPDADQFRKWNVPVPSAISHEVVDTAENPLSDQLTKLMPHSWTLSGNQLTGQTEFGPLVQTIPTDYILIGSDNKGLPIFKKVLS